ncbi:NmrA-like family protein [compost metagenome]
MNYIITGSLGNISKPMVEKLTKAGQKVTVISSNPETKTAIENLGAQAAIGSVTDTDFLAETFTGADAVYLMVPNNFAQANFGDYQKQVGDNYVEGIRRSGVKNVVLLSSIGAHLRQGAGPIDGLGYLEEQLEKLADVNVKILRPTYFFYNLNGMAEMARQAGILGSNFGGTDEKIGLTHTNDIANEAVKHLLALDFEGKTIRYIVSDERTSAEIAQVLGNAINRPELSWVPFSDEDSLQGMLQAGLSKDMAERYVAMGKAFREGRAQEDFLLHKPEQYGTVKLEDFAKEFAAVYNQQ